MNETAKTPGDTGGPSDEQVVEFLRADPEFFARNPALLAELRIPHDVDGAVSLLEHQVGVLRGRLQQQDKRLQRLLANARDNEELAQRMHGLTLALIDCSAADEVFAALYHTLSEQFGADAAGVRLFAPPRDEQDRRLGEFVQIDAAGRVLFDRSVAADKPICGRLPAAQAEFLFGAHAADIASAAVLPLGSARRFGLLAIGSRDPQRFHPGMGTMFLRNLAEVVTRVLLPHVATG